jgi:hypothetical protein
VTEYFWQFDTTYQLVAFMGNDPANALVLQQRSGSIELKTQSDSTPKLDTVSFARFSQMPFCRHRLPDGLMRSSGCSS